MIIDRFVVGQLRTNCYFLVCPQINQAVIIDPGDEGDFLSEKILQLKIRPQMILLTHGHFDHLLAAEELRLNFKIPIFLHQADFSLIKNIRPQEKILLPQETKFLKDKQTIKFGQEKLKVIHTPGHSPGSVCYYGPLDHHLFSGDLIFRDGFGRTDFSYSSSKKLNQSIKKISFLPPKTIVYPGHGEEFKLEDISPALCHSHNSLCHSRESGNLYK